MAILVIGLNSTLKFMETDILFMSVLFFFLVDLVLPKVGIVIKLLIAMVVVHRTFYIGSFFSPHWLGWLVTDVGKDLAIIVERGLTTVSPVTAMTLTLGLVIVGQALYLFLISLGKGALPLLFIGSALLTGASLWAGDGRSGSVVLYVIIGLVIMGTARLQRDFAFPVQRWLSVLLIWVICLTSVAWALPDGNMDMGNWWERALTWNIFGPDGPPSGRIGYGSYDGNLGGALELDPTPIMLVKSPVPVYLRGETRSVYTGNGWQAKPRWDSEYPVSPQLQGEQVTITIEILEEQGQRLFAPRYPLSFEFYCFKIIHWML